MLGRESMKKLLRKTYNFINYLFCIPLDPAGHEKAANELTRVLKPGGTLYIGTPVGQERVCFDAHRLWLSIFCICEAQQFK